jgi:hypothetical protein
MRIYRGQWAKEELESGKPHVIVDSIGKQRLPVSDLPPFKNRAVATRLLNQLRRKPSPLLLGDPKTWSVKLYEEV